MALPGKLPTIIQHCAHTLSSAQLTERAFHIRRIPFTNSQALMDKSRKIVVVGLGYVGLPLAISLARSCPVIGFDIDSNRVGELEACEDRTREVGPDRLRESTLTYSADPASITGADIYIVTVPTPVTE